MKTRLASDQDAANQVAQIFQEILATLPSGCASLLHIEEEEGKDHPAEVSLLPSNAASAPFGASFFSGRLYGAFFGRPPLITNYEAPWELNLRCSDDLEKHFAVLKKMCEAVVAGKCQHRIGTLSLTGMIRASDGSIFRVVDLSVFRPRLVRKIVVYEPYKAGFEAAAPSSSTQSV